MSDFIIVATFCMMCRVLLFIFIVSRKCISRLLYSNLLATSIFIATPAAGWATWLKAGFNLPNT